MDTKTIWQIDYYRRPLQDKQGQKLWELLICTPNRNLEFMAMCPQSEVNANWVVAQLQKLAQDQSLPNIIQVFRPQCLGLIETAAQTLGLKVQPTRRTTALKQWLLERAEKYQEMEAYNGEFYNPLLLDVPPPVPLAENLWGDRWRFASLPAGNIQDIMERPIPILGAPEFLLPLNLGLSSILPVPGVVIDGGRQSMRLARWLETAEPYLLNYIPGEPDGLILETGLVDRWVVATFSDREVSAAGQVYEERKEPTQGLHFLLVQPDDSGMTYSGFWLL
ncbi:Tab2/Atab2 family RNA-binding protein [Okeania sp.]|uniref:Tab2/Atab2 family RNA-binding protein n=1 Tax=Okeania sp. TaxID=3100323 RepID=UPI002B4ADDF8|nr:Tab2/Atab2 family RNA-binding protein [Okeania sp.]MEB3343027.1 Tab2/Atab2 family RNA-binding protein [Okeania sp.]